ncbi:MAG: TIGR00282 family metallophosphoesterase [Desulfuromonas sp.]|nr:MAG: TIGR00282 family metallophosphoesterase [Desulfuromonas sp.]
MNILFIGDIVGRAGRIMLREHLPRIIDREQIDFVIANGENAAAGFGLTTDVSTELLAQGIDVLTSGNHIWDKREIYPQLEKNECLLRPANYPPGAPGRGYGLFSTSAGYPVGVVNLEGRVFMNPLDCPFRSADAILEELRRQTAVIIVDMHAEATSEKQALARYLDGRVSLVVGTHTHVQTADEQILPGGTAYLTDAGMTGGSDSIIGMRQEGVIERFLTQLPTRFDVGKNAPILNGVICRVEQDSGKAQSIERVFLR